MNKVVQVGFADDCFLQAGPENGGKKEMGFTCGKGTGSPLLLQKIAGSEKYSLKSDNCVLKSKQDQKVPKGEFVCNSVPVQGINIRHEGDKGYRITLQYNKEKECPLYWKGLGSERKLQFQCSGVGDYFSIKEGEFFFYVDPLCK